MRDPCDRVLPEPMGAESELALGTRVLDGDLRAVARAISLIENGVPEGAQLVRDLFSHTGHAWLVGVTGPPGVGKSTLVDRVTTHIRSGGRRVGVIAEDGGGFDQLDLSNCAWAERVMRHIALEEHRMKRSVDQAGAKSSAQGGAHARSVPSRDGQHRLPRAHPPGEGT